MISLKYLKESISNFNKLIKDEPKDAAIKIFAALMGFNVGGGGIDGDGGIPDLDLMVSIGAHRSIITHSVLPTIFFEGLFLSMIGLVKIVHKNLPAEHDPLWDDIKNNNEKVLETFFNGMSAGLIFHLGIDATLDGDYVGSFNMNKPGGFLDNIFGSGGFTFARDYASQGNRGGNRDRNFVDQMIEEEVGGGGSSGGEESNYLDADEYYLNNVSKLNLE